MVVFSSPLSFPLFDFLLIVYLLHSEIVIQLLEPSLPTFLSLRLLQLEVFLVVKHSLKLQLSVYFHVYGISYQSYYHLS